MTHRNDHDSLEFLQLVELKHLVKLAGNILDVSQEILHRLPHPTPHHITQFSPIQELFMQPLVAGSTAFFRTTSLPAGTSPDPARLPSWGSSDSVNAPVTVNPNDTTGLSASVDISTSAPEGTPFSLTITYTNADGTVATRTDSFVTVPVPSPDITDFTPIVQVDSF